MDIIHSFKEQNQFSPIIFNLVVIHSFFMVAANNRGYGHLAVCGSKDSEMHVIQPMNIGAC